MVASSRHNSSSSSRRWKCRLCYASIMFLVVIAFLYEVQQVRVTMGGYKKIRVTMKEQETNKVTKMEEDTRIQENNAIPNTEVIGFNIGIYEDDEDDDGSEDETNYDPFRVAYAVSFIKCGDFQTNSAGLVDASLILRHSIHQISSRNPNSGSKYSYKMYAIVHKNAKMCSEKLKDVGFEIVVVDPPIRTNEIRGEFLRTHIHKEWCCGHDEFVKLYAFTLPEKIIVHVDIDFAFYKPMDHLFDAILYDKDSPEGKLARQKLELERPNEPLSDKIGAFITRDWPQVAPGKFPPAFQAGFLVTRRDPDIMEEIIEVIKEGNYTSGWGRGYGWAGTGHGGYVGAMAMQGVVAYFYDFVKPNYAVELNQCRHNHMGMDVKYRHNPNFQPRRVKKEYIGGCRNTLPECEDCMTTNTSKIYSVHYTQCRKPWQCMGIANPNGRNAANQRASAIPTDIVNAEHCYELIRLWHELRTDFEHQLYILTGDETIWNGTKHEYRKDIFLGHCQRDGNTGYQPIMGNEETFLRVDELYD